MSNHSDMSSIHNALKAIEAQQKKNEKTLSWIVMLVGASILVSILTFIIGSVV